jgi:DNA polymerase III epsilon subunit-like protein
MNLFIDTETDKPEPKKPLFCYQIAAILKSSRSTKILEATYNCVTNDWIMTLDGVTKMNSSLVEVLKEFTKMYKKASTIVGHNLYHDMLVVTKLIKKCKMKRLPERKGYCTMVEGAFVCQIRQYMGFKWPSLTELHQHLFGTDFNNKHQALGDAQATMACYYKMIKIK